MQPKPHALFNCLQYFKIKHRQNADFGDKSKSHAICVSPLRKKKKKKTE